MEVTLEMKTARARYVATTAAVDAAYSQGDQAYITALRNDLEAARNFRAALPKTDSTLREWDRVIARKTIKLANAEASAAI